MVGSNYNLVSLNVRGLNNVNKRKAVFRWLQKSKYDVILLQETHTTLDVESVWRSDWKGPVFFSHGTSNSRGCAILIRDDLDYKTVYVTSDRDGRHLIVKCSIVNEPITIVNIYAPNKETDQVTFLKDLDETMSLNEITSLDELIMGGDWNVVRDPELDKSGGILQVKQNSVDCIQSLMSKFNLNDVWRIKNPNTKRYSWRQINPLVQCRLDYWLISDSLYDKVTKTDIIPSIRSDHSAILLQFQNIPNPKRGQSFWKFNSSLLQDKKYTEEMRRRLSNWKIECDMSDKRMKWEMIKYEIRKFTINFSKAKKQETQKIQRDLERKLCNLERNITNANLAEYNNVKRELLKIDDDKVNGQIIRSKVQWHEEGERSTKYFLGLEKSRAVKKHAQKLMVNNGRIITNPEEILAAQAKFYETLYSQRSCGNEPGYEHFFDHVETLSDTDKANCEGLITIGECEQVLKSFKNNKSPGNDGIPSEFYQFFWSEVGETVVQSFNYAYDNGELSTSQKQAIITLIDKGKDRLLIENWRPISLLNVDYKIASKVISARLNDNIPNLVKLNQTGFVKGRYINDTVRALFDTIEYCKISQHNGLFLMIDFEKAFDSLDWKFLFKTLEVMNFGDSFVKWVKIFYNNIESCVCNNGITSSYFKLKRGVRQGDPLSSYLFILCVEVMAVTILNNNKIRGITVNNQELKLLQYADDTTAVLKDEQSAIEFISQVVSFGKLSGLRMNTKKTEAIWLGNVPTFKLPNNIKWSDKPIKVLGVYIGWDLMQAYQLSITTKIVNIKNMLHSWKHRKLTLNGRVLIIKALAISQIIYLASLIPFTHEIIKEIEVLLYEFLWGVKTHKVKKAIIVQDFMHGGHKMIDLQSMIMTQKLKWIRLYFNNHDCLWRPLMEYIVNVENLNVFLRSDFDFDCNVTGSTFYLQVLKSLYDLNKVDVNNTVHNLNKQFIFYNKKIKINGRMIYDSELFRAGLWRVNDLFKPDGTIITFNDWKLRGVSKSKFLTWRGLLEQVRSLNFDTSNTDTIVSEKVIFLPTNEVIDIQKTNSKDIYSSIVKLRKEQPKAIISFMNLFPSFQDVEHDNAFVIPRVCTNNNVLKEFQFKILHRYLPTNNLLFKMKKVDSCKCTFCGVYRESLVHMFYDCFCVKNVWLKVQTVLTKVTDIDVKLAAKDIILGYQLYSRSISSKLVNNVILHVKLFVWKCKLLCKIPSYENLKDFINYNSMYEQQLEMFLTEM